jgi:hypothetical protein
MRSAKLQGGAVLPERAGWCVKDYARIIEPVFSQ